VKAVLDTNVLVSALLYQGTPHRILLAAEQGLYELVISEEMLRELERVLLQKFRLASEETQEAIQMLRAIGTQIEIEEPETIVAEDPDDDKFLAAALASGAPFLVSGDKHLLRLRAYKKVQIVTAREFLEQILRESNL
jgi:putative PIN family toxin of toxin-antitoxin system